jgi:hypothetical protein
MLNKIPTEPEIFASKVDHVAAKNEKHFLLSFRQVPKNWQVTTSFMVWFFFSWGIDENLKS